MSRRPDRTPSPRPHLPHAPLDSRQSPLLLPQSPSPSSSPTHHSSNPNSTTSHQPQTATSPPSLSSPSSMDDDDDSSAAPPPTAPPPPSRRAPVSYHTPSFPAREDCWSEDATYTLVDAWGDRYRELNRGNLRQKHWQEVADAVNARHGHIKKARRTDIQCKNRIDTLKKKYKTEKARVLESNGDYNSPWPFFAGLDSLIGSSFKPSPTVVLPHRRTKTPPAPPPPVLPPPPSSVPVGPRSKRPAPSSALIDHSFFRRNFSAMAAAAAAAVEAEEDSDTSRSRLSAGSRSRNEVEAHRQLAEAIGRFGEIYERVEEAKQRQMVELEKQRMQFAKDLEVERMQLFMESRIQLQKIKRANRTSESDDYL